MSVRRIPLLHCERSIARVESFQSTGCNNHGVTRIVGNHRDLDAILVIGPYRHASIQTLLVVRDGRNFAVSERVGEYVLTERLVLPFHLIVDATTTIVVYRIAFVVRDHLALPCGFAISTDHILVANDRFNCGDDDVQIGLILLELPHIQLANNISLGHNL
nr:MAG TPA: hypothetical protein [Crassvirales sp.]